MNGQAPFVLRFASARHPGEPAPGAYCEEDDLRVQIVDGARVPLVLSEDEPPEAKTMTEVERERED